MMYMKKILIILSAFVFCLFACTCSAEEIHWSDMEADVFQSDPDSKLYAIPGTNLLMWTPSIFTEEQPLSEEEMHNGYLFALRTDDANTFVIGSYIEVETGMEDLQQLLAEDGFTNITSFVVNGIPAISFYDTEIDFTHAFFLRETENPVMLSFYSRTDEDFPALAAIMIASVHPDAAQQ